MGGVGQCCGVYQFRAGDFVTNNKVAYATIDGLAASGAATVLSWCPSCQISIGEVSLPNYETQFGNKPFELDPFLGFLAGHADRLAVLMKRRVEKRIALHERPVFPEVIAAVKKLLSIVPGAELIEIDVPRVGTQANSLAQLPDFKRELVQREFAAIADAGVTTLATIYHACHRQICDAGEGRSFEIVNFMEILGEGLGLYSEDLYKRLKLIGDIDEMIVETAPLIEANRLDLDTVRAALYAEVGVNAGGSVLVLGRRRKATTQSRRNGAYRPRLLRCARNDIEPLTAAASPLSLGAMYPIALRSERRRCRFCGGALVSCARHAAGHRRGVATPR